MKKTIKAWAHLNEKGKVISTSLGRSRPMWMYLGSWSFQTDPETTIPCTITYTLPAKSKKPN